MSGSHGNVVYNLNIPFPNRGEIALTRLGNKRYTPDIVERIDPRGRTYLLDRDRNTDLLQQRGE